MNCNEISELIPAVLDGELRAVERPSIEQHLNTCQKCRNELELHSMAKRIVQQRLHHVPASAELSRDVFASLRDEGTIRQRTTSLFSFLPFHLSWKPMVAFGGALAVVLVFLFVPFFPEPPSHATHPAPSDADIIHQTYNNFDRLLSGALSPQIASDNPFDVRQFFAQKASFNVKVPHMKHCTLRGGIFSNYNTAQIAHVLYEYNEKLIYVYQVNLRDILDENPLMLPCDIKEELLQNGWYIRSHESDCTLILRIVDSTVCCTIADMSKEDLFTYLEENQ